MYSKVVAYILIVSVFQNCDCARILGIVPTPSYSHQIVFRPIWRELSLKGHQVTVLTTDPMNDPFLTNLTEINLHFVYKLAANLTHHFQDKNEMNPINIFNVFLDFYSSLLDTELDHPEVKRLINNDIEHFDLVMSEFIFPTMLAFAERFKCPSIAMMSVDGAPRMYSLFGNPAHPVLNPNFSLPFGDELTFFQRIASVFFNYFITYTSGITLRREQLTVDKHFGKNYPSLEEMLTKISLLFVNTNSIFHRVRPIVPAVIQFGGGTHLVPAKPLPKDLKKILDDASEGFIYFSLGSNVQSKDLSEEKRKLLLEVFGELPYKVLWKFELDDVPGKPNNVIISKWFPQQDVFRHPHIKLFITQGGLQSMEEAIFNHVPILGIPFFGDQPSNVKRITLLGLGLSLDHETMTKESFKESVLEVIENSKYRNKAKELAELALDQPMTGLERAIWWTEYVLRHKGAKHLRSPALDIPSYQYYLLDVIAFCVLVVAVIVYILFALIKLAIRIIKYFVPKRKVKVP